jgi:hypothetical protein
METRKEFEERMLKNYPLLYADMYGDPRHTIMAFGIEVGKGWWKIIEDLSMNLEEKIRPIYEEVIADPDAHCAQCGRKRQWHWLFYLFYVVKYFFMNRWKAFKAYPQWRKRDKSWGERDKRLKRSVWKTLYGVLFKFKWYKACKKWRPSYPKAVQVKEKFGGLRFYMTYYVEEIEKLIDEAESKSYQTCERCGAPGKSREGGWILTLCDECEEKKNLERK